jgi:hypothetical protein
LQVPGFVVVAPVHVLVFECPQSGLCPWQHGSPCDPQQTPLKARPLRQLPVVTQLSVLVLHATPAPEHWRTLYVLPPVA